MNRELPDVQAGFTKPRGTKDQIAKVHWIIEKASVLEKNICFIDYANAFVWITTNCGKFLNECEYQTVRTGHGTMDWFQTGKGICQGCILSPCLFNLYAEYIMRNAVLDEAQAGIKIAGRNINNLRYADDTILMVESKEELKSLLMNMKEDSEKTGLKLTFNK